MILKWINPLVNTEDVLKIERPFVDYTEWIYLSYKETIPALDDLLKDLDCTREYNCGRPMMTTILNYNNKLSEYYYYLLRLDNYILYNEYVDKLIDRHVQNIIFEYEYPIAPKIKSKPKRNSKKRTIPNTFIKQKSIDMFTGKEVYYYDNIKTGEHYESNNPDLITKIKKRKDKVKRTGVPIEAMTFSFKKK